MNSNGPIYCEMGINYTLSPNNIIIVNYDFCNKVIILNELT
jgi:hypothetical protein